MIICGLMLLIIAHQLPAQVSEAQESTKLQNNTTYDDIEINGLLVDETITKVGRDFYELFYQYWNAPKSSMNYTLFIKERPMMGLGSEVVVVLNDTEIFKRRVQPRYSMIEAVTKYAVGYTKQYILNYESIVRQLGSQDQQGTGIY